MNRRRTKSGLLVTDLGKLRSRRPKTDRLTAINKQDCSPEKDSHERLLEELGAADITEVISVLMPRIIEDLSDERKVGLYFEICSLVCMAAERGEDISAVIPAVVKLLERAAERPELYNSGRNEAALVKATASLRIAAEKGMAGMGSGEVRSVLDAMLSHTNEQIRIDAGAAIFCLPEPLESEEVVTLFSEELLKPGSAADITPLCMAAINLYSEGIMRLRLLHKGSEASEPLDMDLRGAHGRRWKRRITDEGTEIWLRGRDGAVEAKVGGHVMILLPDFDVDDAPVSNTESVLWPYMKDGEGSGMELASGFFIRGGAGRLIASEDGNLEDAKIGFELYGERGAYRRQFLLSGLGSRRSFAIDGMKVDVELEPDGIRISKSDIEAGPA